MQNIANQRLASVRKKHELCDAMVEVDGDKIPVHLALVVDISPVFEAALCGNFKEGRSKTLVLKESTRKAVDVILDFSYGTISDALSTDVELCLQVWREAHRYEITGLVQHASSSALDLACTKHRVEVFQHAMLYGGDANRKRASKDLAKNIVAVADDRADSFLALHSKQMVSVFSSKYLVATEDEKLEFMMKRRELKKLCRG